ncbi:hypothetical protein MKW94_025734 [Papaver nudicaule]|uniref:Proliferating cell nuclear antigen PCNA N-terminal domain-containing protein n=1 Tax=Papaver nudicaule TaxID=74823 RepID=A0AA41UY53_PAPNU|nr:hypothetical protein [Papaver nudicaule]
MLELRLVQGSLLKKVMESLKDLVNDANFDLGFLFKLWIQVMLLLLLCYSDLKVLNIIDILKCAGNDDIITIKGDDGGDTVTFMFESPSQDKIADFEMKLMDIGADDLDMAIFGLPQVELRDVDSEVAFSVLHDVDSEYISSYLWLSLCSINERHNNLCE